MSGKAGAAGGQQIKEIGNEGRNKKKGKGAGADSDSDDDDDELGMDDIQLEMGGDGGRKKKRGGNDDYSDDDSKPKKSRGKSGLPGSTNQDGGVVIDLNNVIELGCTPIEKDQEKRMRQLKIEEIEKRIDRLMLEIQGTQNRQKRERMKLEHLGLKNLIQ